MAALLASQSMVFYRIIDKQVANALTSYSSIIILMKRNCWHCSDWHFHHFIHPSAKGATLNVLFNIASANNTTISKRSDNDRNDNALTSWPSLHTSTQVLVAQLSMIYV
mmetsp:Transcript_4355/g.9867  ORF Transcript_4355/g.9867 Transcript_4355/m.9867 type:complete len:109 (-) Transcript_4355:477-803(-)